ncbi:anthranilate synthase component II [Halolamina pelagica]|uniref:anthranilate synthase n=1 Tax=Halolamina pelagica TaxID=699431 RepID=A0A0P7GQ56_9EURY|nr:anthranilate synthase component II [Halolamina pelagica]
MSGPEILVIDNYDSFVYNLVQYVGEAVQPVDGEVTVRRNDAVDAADVRDLDPDGIVVSPGPGTPQEAGVSMAVFAALDYPTLGVCLGHQALCAANGAPVGHADAVVHGKPSRISHDGGGCSPTCRRRSVSAAITRWRSSARRSRTVWSRRRRPTTRTS